MADVTQFKQRYMLHLERLMRVGSLRTRDVVARAAPNGKPREGGSATKIRDSIEVTEPAQVGFSIVCEIRSNAPQALFTDQGTKGPYVIRPRSEGGVLVFFWDDGPTGAGDYVFRYVTHPGIAAQNWFSEPMVGYWHQALLESIGTVP